MISRGGLFIVVGGLADGEVGDYELKNLGRRPRRWRFA